MRNGPPRPATLRPGPLEVASGLAIGGCPAAWPPPAGGASPRHALEAVVGRALLTEPCLVSFSGGRDSSAVLAVAVDVARRQGLPLPVPVSYRFPTAPASAESHWQEAVVRHLDVDDWERVTIGSELDAVGPVAHRVLRRHGLLWPFNAHFHLPLLERAAGGTLLTGIGGDELLGPQLWDRARDLRAGRPHPRRYGWPSLAAATSPQVVRRAVLTRRDRIDLPWLAPGVATELNRRRARWRAGTPLAWNGAVAHWWSSRARALVVSSMATLAHEAGAAAVHPFLDPAVVGAVGRRWGAAGPGGRTVATADLVGDLLPAPVVSRRSKPHFDQAFFSDHSRELARTWTGSGVDSDLVDVEALASGWRSPSPDARSFMLLQAAWLGARTGEPV